MPSVRRALLALLTPLALVLGFVTPMDAPSPASASTTAAVSVTVLGPDGEPFTWGAPAEQLQVRLQPLPSGVSRPIVVGPDGTGVGMVPSGSFQVEITYVGRQNVLDGWGVGSATQSGSAVYTVTAEGPNEITAQFRAGGMMTGSVTGDDELLTSALISVYPVDFPYKADGYSAWFDSATQQYTVTRLRPGVYKVLIEGDTALATPLVGEWVGGALLEPYIDVLSPGGGPTQAGATVSASIGSVFAAPPLSLEPMSMITGTITWPGTSPDFFSQEVVAYLDGVRIGSIGAAGGRYSIRNAARYDGEWTVCVRADYRPGVFQWAQSCWSPAGATSLSDAAPITAVPRAVLPGFDIVVAEGAILSFDVYVDLDGAGGAAPVPSTGSEATFYRLSNDGERLEPDSTQPLFPGTYAVEFVDRDRPEVGRTWLTPSGATTTFLTEQNLLPITAGDVTYQQVILRPYVRSFDRIAGSDRFETAVRISEATIASEDTPASVVYIASGLNFPDALSAGPIAAQQGGSMLLVDPTAIPASVEAELLRLSPQRIVIVGGTGVVSTGVENALRRFVDGDATRVSRVSGADRYVVSRALVATSFDQQRGMPIFLATGRNFPDALAAGPAAAALGGAVLLVDGDAPTMDLATRALLDTLEPSAIILVGGSGVVSDGILAAAQSRYGGNVPVVRLSGPDRYTGAAVVNETLFEDSTTAFLATGASFADALAGGVLAGQLGAPLFLTQPDCIPGVTQQGMTTMRSSLAVILGGTGAVSANVQGGGVCGLRSSDAPTAIVAPGSRSVSQSDQEIERLREALALP